MSEEQVMNQKEIGKRLTEIMRLHDISEKELAMHLGRDETTIKRYKRGEIVIPAELGCYLRKKYRVDLNFLYNGEEPVEGIIEILESDSVK